MSMSFSGRASISTYSCGVPSNATKASKSPAIVHGSCLSACCENAECHALHVTSASYQVMTALQTSQVQQAA